MPSSHGPREALSKVDITGIVTAHAEGPLVGLTIRSMLAATDAARSVGLRVELLAVLDNPDRSTREALSGARGHGMEVMETSYADQGRVRNDAAALARGDYVAFLDGDDLWSENWLVVGHAVCQSDPGRVIAHPELNWRFEDEYLYAFSPDQEDELFDIASVRLANPWDALCLAPRAAYQDHPFSRRAIKDGFAYEDWHHNMQTLLAGYVNKVAPETIHFKRRRPGSQHTQSRANFSLTSHSQFLEYSWWANR